MRKDLIFVGIQFLLFIVYFTPLFTDEFSTNDFVKYAALTVGISGLLLVAACFIQMNKSLTPLPTPRISGRLIQDGLYKYVRHPLYSGLITAAFGFAVYQGSWWKVLIGSCLLILFYFKSSYEEKLLTVKYEEYRDYQQKTFRFFPFF